MNRLLSFQAARLYYKWNNKYFINFPFIPSSYIGLRKKIDIYLMINETKYYLNEETGEMVFIDFNRDNIGYIESRYVFGSTEVLSLNKSTKIIKFRDSYFLEDNHEIQLNYISKEFDFQHKRLLKDMNISIDYTTNKLIIHEDDEKYLINGN